MGLQELRRRQALRTKRARWTAFALCGLGLMAGLAGCRAGDPSPEPGPSPSPTLRADVSVTEISLGRTLETSRRVTQPREDFAPGDTVYASVVTEGSARRVLLRARWTYQGSEVVSESSLDIAPSGATVTEFHVSRPEGLSRGRYQVEIFLDGASAGKRGFSVQ
jgi:hypothetical protein